MTSLHHLAGHWIVHSLGWTLLHFCWQGAVVAVVLWCSLQLLADHSAKARYTTACWALALMVVLPLATFANLALTDYRLASATNGAGIAYAPAFVVRAGMGDSAWFERLATALNPALPWVLLAWLAGSALFLFRLSVGLSVTRKLRTLALSPAADELHAILATLRQRLAITRPVLLMHSALVQVPTVVGWLRPVVLLPASCFTGLPLLQIEAILCHELAHIRRHDYLVSVVQSVVEALLFYHPAVWWVSNQVRHQRECCCDDIAVTVGGDALAYAKALTTLAQRSLYPQVMLGANGGILTMRVKRLLVAESASVASQVSALALLLLLAISALTIGTTARAESGSTAIAAPEEVPVLAPASQPLLKAPVRPALHTMLTGNPKQNLRAPNAASPTANPEPAPAVVQQEGTPPVRVAGGVEAGQILYKTVPVYPPVAKAAHVSGAVVLHALISKTGDILNLQIISGPEMLRASALNAVSQWKYKPFLLNGEPTEVDTTITVNYNFAGDDEAPPPPPLPDTPAPTQEVLKKLAPPQVIFAPEPEFSEQARAKHVHGGDVQVHLVVDDHGSPTQVQLIHGIGNGLDQKALEAVRQYRFKPATDQGKPVPYPMDIAINFRIF